ncbi:MAG: diacylglyceryl transferase [Chlorobi bacterium]|nr:diacylglyceryl transferase [Chlorobiota bacterium]
MDFLKSKMNRLKEKWGIKDNAHFWLIFSIFGITGISSMFVKIPVFHALGFSPDNPWYVKVLIEIVVVLPLYNVLLLVYGFLFGQFRFFLSFEIKFFKGLVPRFFLDWMSK